MRRQGTGVEGFWQRLKRHRLVQWSAAYIAASFALIQVLDVVAQRFGWSDLIEKLIILALAAGFFVALVLAWYHGERGAQRVGGTELLIIALLLAIGGGLLWRYARLPAPAAVAAAAAKPVSTSALAAEPPGLLASVVAKIPEKSVAVLPFANESGDKDEQFFSDGLSEDLITALSQFGGLKVIDRDSAFQFRDSKDSIKVIALKLGVAHLLEGSVQRAGDEVRVTATLVNADDGSILWSQRYDKPYKDLFKLQDDITQAVAGALKAKLLTQAGAVVQSDRPPSGNLDAWTAYQHGVAYFALGTEASWRKAIAAFEEAARLDPHYAAAYARLSYTWTNLAEEFLGGTPAAQTNAEARVAANTALKLNPDSSLAHQARALLLSRVDMNWNGAATEARRALQLAPNDPGAKFALADALATLGQVQGAVDLARQALDADPRNVQGYYFLSKYLAGLGRLDEAWQMIDTAIALQPDATTNREQLAVIEILRGDAKAALAAAQQEPPGPWHDVAMATQIGSDRAAADTALKKLIAEHAGEAAYQIAEVYALRKDPDNTFKWLDRAWVNRDPGISNLLHDPFILRYQHDPRFAAYCKKVGLPATTDAVAMK
jgi:TolB-like protein/Flp pilus assembly protein TadD